MAEKWHNELVGGCKGLPTGLHQGEKFLLQISPTKWWVIEPSKRMNGNRRKRPRKAEKEKWIFSCWCCKEDHMKKDCSRKKKKE